MFENLYYRMIDGTLKLPRKYKDIRRLLVRELLSELNEIAFNIDSVTVYDARVDGGIVTALVVFALRDVRLFPSTDKQWFFRAGEDVCISQPNAFTFARVFAYEAVSDASSGAVIGLIPVKEKDRG